MRFTKLHYSNYYYVYDIESTKYEVDDNCPPLAYSYLHGLKGYNYNENMTKDNIEKYADKYIPIRNNIEMQNKFIELNNIAKNNNEITVIFVHNLTYEFYNSIFNMPLLNKELEKDKERIFAISSTKILNIKIENLLFMDTLILFGKGLGVCASEIGMIKNEEHKTYNEIWTEESVLPQWEYDYNEHDLDLVAVYLSKFIKLLNLQDKTLDGFMKTRIITQTGMVKYVCKQINTKQALDVQRMITNETQKSIDKDTQKWIENEVFRGGFCVSVPINTFCINEQVHSVDFASAYPAVMCTGIFPKGKLIRGDGSRIVELNNILLSDEFNYKIYLQQMRLYQPFKMFLFKIKLKNIEIKQFNNGNEIMYISSAKCYEISKKNFIVNGRILKAESLITSGTEMDFILMRLFYNFEIDDIIYEYYPDKIGRLSEYKILSISKFAVEKEAFKKLENSCTCYNNFINKCNEKLVNELTYGDVFNETNVKATPNNMKYIKDVCRTYLMNAKGKLNSQYGIGVQHQFQQDITYNNYQFNIGEEEVLNWNKNENYLQGIYITAHTRFRLLIMAYHLIQNNFDIIYFDTDSIKVKGNKEELLLHINEWNKTIEMLRRQAKRKFRDYNLFLSNFGNFDYEGTYDYFITHGSKRYVTVTNNECSCTISGVNKKANSEGATLYFKKYGLEMLYKNWCGLNTLYDYKLCKRSINFIPKEPMLINDVITDNNGKTCKIKQYSCEGISDKDCGYLLSSYDNPMHSLLRWYYYCKFNGEEYGKCYNVNTKPHTIKLINEEYDNNGYLTNGDIIVEEGYCIEKYAEKLFIKWSKYFSDNKVLDYDDNIYKITHNYSNGVKIINN